MLICNRWANLRAIEYYYTIVLRTLFLLLLLLSPLFCWGEGKRFNSVNLTSRFSTLLEEREAKPDSLLPQFDGEAALRELLRKNPNLWSLDEEIDGAELATALEVELVFIDGVREEQFCEVLSPADTSEQGLFALQRGGNLWKLRMGVDFISGASNTVHLHVQGCLEEAREQLAIAVKKGDHIEVIPPQKVKKEFQEYRINAELGGWLSSRVLKVSREVMRTASCPKDIDDYILLLDIWKEVSEVRVDLLQLSQELDREFNGGQSVVSCSFSREHNRKYSEDWALQCDLEKNRCSIRQSKDGTTVWRYSDELDRFYFRGWRFLGIGLGRQGVRDGGKVLDLKLIPLSQNLYLEAYLNLDGVPLALGLLTITP